MNAALFLYNRFIIRVHPLKITAEWIIRRVVPSSVKIPEGIVTLNRQDPAMSGLLAFGLFEPFATKVFRDQVKEGMTVIDIGANIGYYSLIASVLSGANGRIIAYEPETENHSFLLKNIELNKLSNVTSIKKALSNKEGTSDFYITEGNMSTYALVDNRSASKKISVPTITLDHSLSSLGITKVDVIKMDIEGAEPLALEGMKETLARNRDIIIFTEFYPKAMRRLGKEPLSFLQTLHALGFSIWDIDENSKQLKEIAQTEFSAFVDGFPSGERVKNLLLKRN